MSSTGTRPVRTVQSRSNEALIEADKELINSLKIFSEASNFVAGLTGTPAQNSPKTPAGNYLAREGDSMIGPLALGPPLDFDIEVDANNTIDIGPLNDNAQYTSNIQLDDLQTNSSVLDIISNAAFDGQILVLRTFAPTVPYTISQGTLGNGGNIQTGDSSDLTVGDLQTVTFIFDESLKIEANIGGSWRVISVSSGGGGGTTLPVVDTTSIVKGSVDATKLMRFEVDTLVPTATTVVLTVPATDTTLAGLSISPQTFTGITTFEGSSFSVTSPAIFLGDQVTDAISFGGRINTNVLPISDGLLDLGADANEWKTLFVTEINATSATSVSSPVFSILSATINIGDATSDDINFVGRSNTNFLPTSDGLLDLGADANEWKTLWATEINATSATSISSPVFSILSATINIGDATTDLINFVGRSNTNFLPISGGTLNLGSASLAWNDTFTERLRIETGGVSTSTANQIIADAGGMIFNTPAGDRYEFNISGSPNGIAIEEDRIEFLTTGRQHRIDATSDSINILSENSTDGIELWPGIARSNEAMNCQDLQTKFLNNTSASRYELLLVYTNATTTGQPAIGNLGFMADSSANVESAYAGIVTAIEDDTSTGRDGRMQIVVANNDGAAAAGVGQLTGIGMDIQSDAGTMKLGFFGVTPVTRQSPAATSAAIITALENLGLFV